MVISGLGAMVLWRYFELGGIMYEVGPGVIAGFVPYIISTLFKEKAAA